MTDDKPAQLIVTAYLPHELFQAFVQHIRDFDVAHPGCAFHMLGNTSLSTDELERVLDQVDPPLPNRATFRKN